MNAKELTEVLSELQEINIGLAEIYRRRGGLQNKLFKDALTGPALQVGGEIETPDGWVVKTEKTDEAKCSAWERENAPRSPSGHVLKLKISMPKFKGGES